MKGLRDFSDDDLYEILQKNNKTALLLLAGICSEILRRMIEKDKSNLLEKNAKVPPPGDKDSTKYFMQEMSQEEFQKRNKNGKSQDYKFNLINRADNEYEK